MIVAKRFEKGLNDIAVCGTPTSELRDITCHMGSHLPPDTGERAPPNSSQKGWYSEGWKAELTEVAGYFHSEIVYPLADGHPSKY